MEFIYHGVPAGLEGTTLYPLFMLKEKFPKLFESEIKKYDDHPKRKELPFKNVNKLNCQRGDILHFSPIHPSLIFQALKMVFPEGNRSVKFFKIPISRAKGLPMVLFDMNREGYEFGKEDPDQIFDLVSVENYREIKTVPPQAIAFFNEWKERGERGAPAWGKIPHIFVQGPIDISECEVLDWRDPVEFAQS
jgi:hypothetical protein